MPSTTETRPFQIMVREDKMEVFLEGAPFGEDLGPLAESIRSALSEYAIKPLPDTLEILNLLQAAPHSETHYERLTLVRGEPAVEPSNARLEWEGDFFSPGFAVDNKTGKIDYRRRAAQPEVKPDQLLAQLTAARPGKDGCDVFGRRIKVQRPQRHNVRAGRNVRTVDNPDGSRLFYATIAGRVRWDMKIISVDDVFRVSGDVNMESGNVRHNGAVVIAGDVKSGFSIDAEGDVEVQGTVEAADIRAGGNILIGGGVSGGRAKCAIRARGSVHAKYLLDARIEAAGDVIVEKEIVNATVLTQGEVRMLSGPVVGGEVCAWRDMWIGGAGSERGVPTSIAVGVNPLLERRIAELTAVRKQYQAELERINEVTGPKLALISRLSAEQRRAFTDLLTRSAVCHEHVEHLGHEIEELKLRLQEDVRPTIRIDGEVHAETNLRIRQATLLLHNEMIGPIKFYQQHGEVRFHLERESAQ